MTDDSDLLIRCSNVSKRFCRKLKRSLWYGVKDVAAEFNPFLDTEKEIELRKEEFFALDQVDLELRKGECLGVIGRNGAGKTTILKMISGLMKPDFGVVETRGRVGALIAIGAGFSPILSGRENIYLNAGVLGLSRAQTRDRMSSIIEFSGITEFIDSPVQTYSSGMQVRLGMAIAAHLDPDILLLDEVIAVGDVNFQRKCLDVAENQTAGARSGVILVSHSMEAITKYCSRVIVLDKGRIRFNGLPSDAVKAYLDLNEEGGGVERVNIKDRQGRCSLDVEFTAFESVDLNGEVNWTVEHSDEINIRFSYRANSNIENLIVIITLQDALVDKALTRVKHVVSDAPMEAGKEGECIVKIKGGVLKPGMYSFYSCLVNMRGNIPYDVLDQNVDLPFLTVSSEGVDPGEMEGYFSIQSEICQLQ